jgi:hypothetical protein
MADVEKHRADLGGGDGLAGGVRDSAPHDVDAALTGGNYEVLRSRLATGGQELARRTDALNARRKALFGTTEPQLIATEQIRAVFRYAAWLVSQQSLRAS